MNSWGKPYAPFLDNKRSNSGQVEVKYHHPRLQGWEFTGLDWKGDMSAGPPVPVKQVQPHAGTDPVSYTHLDVYKRQEFCLFFCNTRISKNSDMAKSWATFCCSGTLKV